jgi:hypothetical protein
MARIETPVVALEAQNIKQGDLAGFDMKLALTQLVSGTSEMNESVHLGCTGHLSSALPAFVPPPYRRFYEIMMAPVVRALWAGSPAVLPGQRACERARGGPSGAL